MKNTLHYLLPQNDAGTLSALWPRWSRLLTYWQERLRSAAVTAEPEVSFRGIVTDGNGLPVPFARIEFGNARYYTIANAAGQYVLHVPRPYCSEACYLTAFGQGLRPQTIQVQADGPTVETRFLLEASIPAKVVPMRNGGLPTHRE